MYNTEYGFGIQLKGRFDDIIVHTIEALSDHGFGVLSDIDVKATLKKKLNVDLRQYRILGACNPPLAHQALVEETGLSLLLPYSVIVYEKNINKCMVTAINPVQNLRIVENSALGPLAKQILAKLQAALASLVH